MKRSRSSRAQWVEIEGHGLVAAGRIVAVGLAEAASMRRLVGVWPEGKVLDLTGRQKRVTVLVLDSGHLVISPLPLEAMTYALLGEGDSQ